MKKVFCLIALAAVCLSSTYAATPIKAVADTTVKVKKTHKGVIKKKTTMHKDTTKMKMKM